MFRHIRRFRYLIPKAAIALTGAIATLGCGGAQPDAESVGSVSQDYGHYDLTSSYTGNIADTRGWIIEWRIPQLLNPDAVGVVGQWYYNLESGVYHTGDGWFVYYFGDDNGLTGNEPSCNSQWGSGGTCGGVFSNLQAGQQLVFKYEWCTPAHVASVTGTQLCLYVDLKDGTGYRFLAEDARSTVEMYAHDIEHFVDDGLPTPQIPCSAPTKMVRQQRKTTSGSWVNMTGASTWSFNQVSPYVYQNKQLTTSPASWESCSVPSCTPETDAQFCSRLGATCGSVTNTDNCGTSRTVASCGTCTAPATCGGDGVANQCGGGSGGACAGVTPWDPAKPWYNYVVGERHTGSNHRLYECKTPAFCYLDPAGPNGSFGWTDKGPC
jgi:hypothetical protein